jgi:hypothetical protein
VIAQFAPARVIAILLALARIAPGGLQMPARIGADPYIDIGRRNRQGADALQLFAIPDVLAIGVAIAETLALAQPANARLRVADIGQADGAHFAAQEAIGIDGSRWPCAECAQRGSIRRADQSTRQNTAFR